MWVSSKTSWGVVPLKVSSLEVDVDEILFFCLWLLGATSGALFPQNRPQFRAGSAKSYIYAACAPLKRTVSPFWNSEYTHLSSNAIWNTRAGISVAYSRVFCTLSQPANNRVQLQQIQSKFKTKARRVHSVFMEGKTPKQWMMLRSEN